MIVSEGLLATLIQAVRSADTFGSLPFEWNANDHCFKKKTFGRLAIYKVRYFLALCYTLLVSLQIALTWQDVEMFVKLHTFAILSGQYLCCYTNNVFLSKLDEILAYVNGMGLYEKKRNSNKI